MNKILKMIYVKLKIIEIVAVIKKMWYNIINSCDSTVKKYIK